MKSIYLIPLFFLIFSCSKSDHADKECCSKPATVSDKKEANSELSSELSVYNLSSSWTNSEGEKLVLGDLKGKVQVAAMVYTTCTYACPRIIADLKRIEEEVDKKNFKDVEYLLISIDPEVDTPEKLKQTAAENKFDLDKWTLLTGEKDKILELAMVLGVKYKQSEDGHYAHSNIITVLDKAGNVAYQQEGLGINVEPVVEAIEKVL